MRFRSFFIQLLSNIYSPYVRFDKTFFSFLYLRFSMLIIFSSMGMSFVYVRYSSFYFFFWFFVAAYHHGPKYLNRSTSSIVNDKKIQRTFPVLKHSVVLNVYNRRVQSKRSVLKWPIPVQKTISSYFTRFNVAYKRAPPGFCRFGLSVWDLGRKKTKIHA